MSSCRVLTETGGESVRTGAGADAQKGLGLWSCSSLRSWMDWYLRETDWTLLSSICLFRTSWIWPFSGPCFTFSRPITYKNLGVRMRSRFAVCQPETGSVFGHQSRTFWFDGTLLKEAGPLTRTLIGCSVCVSSVP